jgi:hypothetical protein
MDPVNAYREKIGERLTRRLVQALKDKEIAQDDFAEISTFILDNIDNAKSNEELVQFLEDVARQWPFLSDMVVDEKKEAETQNVQEKVQQIDTLITQNKIDDALQVAKDATDGQNQGGVS